MLKWKSTAIAARFCMTIHLTCVESLQIQVSWRMLFCYCSTIKSYLIVEQWEDRISAKMFKSPIQKYKGLETELNTSYLLQTRASLFFSLSTCYEMVEPLFNICAEAVWSIGQITRLRILRPRYSALHFVTDTRGNPAACFWTGFSPEKCKDSKAS